MNPWLSRHRTLKEGDSKPFAEINDFTSNHHLGQPRKLHMGSLENPPVLWFQETRRIIEATAPAFPLAMAASVVQESITWPQSSISHETAQFGRFTDLHGMRRIAKNEAPPTRWEPVSRSPSPLVMIFFGFFKRTHRNRDGPRESLSAPHNYSKIC